MTPDPAIIALLRDFAHQIGIPETLALAIAYGESQWNPYAVGDNGLAHGLLQVRVDVHGGPSERWTGIDGAKASMAEMGPRWRNAAHEFPWTIQKWDSVGPEAKAVLLAPFWVAAQGAQSPSKERCVEAVNAALALGEIPVDVTVQPPAIKQVPGNAANCYPTRQGFAPEAIVLHIMAGSLTACDSWFANAAAKAGAHFGVGKDGEIHQYFTIDQSPFANGAIEAGYTAKLIDANKQANPNFWTISIEHEGQSGDVVPAAQLQASVQLAAWLWQTFILPGGATDLALDRDHVLRHGDISPKTRPSCPGWSEPFIVDYIKQVAELLSPPAPPVPQPTIEQVQIGLIDKIVNRQWQPARDDLNKILGSV